MVLMDWLEALRGSSKQRRRKLRHDLPVAVDVLEDRTPPDASLLGVASGWAGPHSFDAPPPPLTDDGDDPLQTFSVVQPDDDRDLIRTEESTDSATQTQEFPNLPASNDIVGGILPDVLDTLLLSPFNQPIDSQVSNFVAPTVPSVPAVAAQTPVSGSGAVGSPPPVSLGSASSQSGTSSSSVNESGQSGLMSGPAPFTTDTTASSLETATFTTLTVTNSPPLADHDNVALDEDTSATFDVLANDSDPDGDTITIMDVTQGIGGSVDFTNTNVTYTANVGYWGPDQFSYTVSDGNGGMDTAYVYVSVNSVNHAPDAVDDSLSTDEDSPVTLELLANDSDHDGDAITVIGVADPANGEVEFTDTGIIYTPYSDFWGTDQFSYTISDGDGGTATALVNVTVNPVNDDPVAVDDNVSVDEDGTATFDVLQNDSDVDGDTLTITGVTGGEGGSVSIVDNKLYYVPHENFNGADQLNYTVEDGNGGMATTDVFVTVNPVNDLPVANDDSVATDEDTPVTVDVLSNDTDIDDDLLFITAVSSGANGTVTFTSHDLTYTPAKDWSGNDQFTYTLNDGHGGTDQATVAVIVNPVEDWPVANEDFVIIGEGGSATINLIGNDSDAEGPVTVDYVDDYSYFGGIVTDNGDGTATYDNWMPYIDPETGEDMGYSVGTGWDGFGYEIADSAGNVTSGWVDIYISPADPDYDDPPIAGDDYETTAEDTPVTFGILGNDWDDQGFTLDEVWTSDPNATVSWGSDGNVTYTPAPDFHGEDYVYYTITDSSFQSALGTVIIEVTPVNYAPEVVVNAAWTGWEQTIRIDVLDGATDVEMDAEEPGNELIVTEVVGAVNGQTWFDGTSVYYKGNESFTTGTDTFTYTVEDGHGGFVTEDVTVTMVQVTDWSVEYKDSDDNWNASPNGEAVWSHEELRWKPTYGPWAPNQQWIKWIAQDWDAFENGDDHEFISPFAEYDSVPDGDEWAYGNPGVGIWAILPQINFAPDHQSDFVAQMDKAAVEVKNPEGQGDAQIATIYWTSASILYDKPGIIHNAKSDTNLKFFPDAINPNGPVFTEPMNEAWIVAKVTPDIETTLYFKVIDVDDPSDDDGPIDSDPGLDPNTGTSSKSDLVGGKGDNIPTPGSMEPDSHLLASARTHPDFVNENFQTVHLTFTINWIQPGNNYRVAVSMRKRRRA